MIALGPTRLDISTELHESLGFVPLHRIGTDPPPGTATEADVIRHEGSIDKRLYELVDGVLLEKAVGSPESFLAATLIGILYGYVKQHNLGITTSPDGMYRMVTRNVRMPDVAFIPWANLPGRRRPKSAVWGVAPGLAVEILSESNTVAEMERKLVEYRALGIAVVWIIDPDTETATIHHLDGTVQHLTATDSLKAESILPGFALPLAELFAEPMPPTE